jgi:ribA/ribD-fused uncharacterized protein
MRKTEKFTFFWTIKDVFSNLYPAIFVYKGIQFNCSEQFITYAKAKTFNDEKVAEKVLAAQDPKIHKDLSNLIDNYDEDIWKKREEKVVYLACYEKFKQNSSLFEKLLETEDTILVDTSLTDTQWGIGMRDNDIGVEDPNNWKGLKKFGAILTQVRDNLKKELNII